MKYLSDTLSSIAEYHVNLFHKGNVEYIEYLVKLNSFRRVFLMVYMALCNDKKIFPVELLPKEDKDKLKYYTIEYANGRLSVDQAVELSKVLYTIEYLLQ